MTNSRLFDSMNFFIALSDVESKRSCVCKNDVTTIMLHVLFKIIEFDINDQHFNVAFFFIEILHCHDTFERLVLDANYQHVKAQNL